MGLAAGYSSSYKGTVVELVGVKFIQPFHVGAGRKLTSIHHFGSGMQIIDSSVESVVASISEVNAISVLPPPSASLQALKNSHTQKAELVNMGGMSFQRGAFQTIQSVNLSEDGASALAQIGLPAAFSHEHDAYYHMHPALLDGATFQLLNFVSGANGGICVPGISRVVMHHSGSPAWAHLELAKESTRVNLFDEAGYPLLSIVGVHYLPSDSVNIERIFVAVGENYTDSEGLESRNHAAHCLQKYLHDTPTALTDYPWLENVLHQSHHDALTEEQLSDNSVLYRITVDLYEDLPKLLSDPLRMISLHPEHDSMYESKGMSSTNEELASLLSLVCNEWYGTKLRVFEVGTGSGGLTRRALPLLEDSLESYTCSNIFPV